MRIISSILLIVFTCISCVTTYTGPKPDFSLKGDAAQKEYEKFKFNDSYWRSNPRVVQMGPEKTNTYRSSLDSIIGEVSPEATGKLHRAEIVGFTNLAVVSTLTVWALANMGRNFAPEELTLFWAIIGASLGTSLVIIPLMAQDGIEQYNNDLQKKFSPGVALNISL